MTTDIREFLKKFDIEINDLDLFQEAVTHNSLRNESNFNKSYENLEFLGDAVLQLKSSMFLYKKFSDHSNSQGELTKARKALVCEETLAYVAQKIELGYLIRMGQGEKATGGREKPRLLADVFESITAAIFLDSGATNVEKFLNSTLLRDDVLNIAKTLNIDYKTKFQELIQADKKEDIEYVELGHEKLDDNSNNFYMVVRVDGLDYGHGSGKSKKIASQAAAKNALEKLKGSNIN